jgi:ribosome-associated protein
MLQINDHIQIPDDELRFTFVRSGGPGGQNVNKVASKAVLRWNVAGSPSLPEEVRQRLTARQRGRITTEGDLLITSQRYRDQGRNVEDCREKLRALVLEATHTPKKRKKTKPSRASRERRLATKRQQARRKAARRRPIEE